MESKFGILQGLGLEGFMEDKTLYDIKHVSVNDVLSIVAFLLLLLF